MSSHTDDLRDIIAAQSKAIQDLTSTLMSLTKSHEPTIASRPEPEFKLYPQVIRIPDDIIIGGCDSIRVMKIRRGAM
jgi:hypothetical protein